MEEREYIEQRLDDQIAWYDRKSQWNQQWHKRLRLIEIICACSIPFILSFASNNVVMTGLAGLFGVIVAVVASVISLYKFEENWVAYRTTCETLRHEKFLHATQSKPYESPNAFALLVQRVESMISKENTEWHQYAGAESKEKESST